MLRSWIERARYAFAPAASAGIAIGRDYVGFARIVAGKSGWQVCEVSEAKLAIPLFVDAPSGQAASALVDALSKFPDDLKSRYLPVHVSLPDALVEVATFELEQIPKTRAARIDLLRLRFARLGISSGHTYACQILERGADKQFLFGMALEEYWQRFLTEALDRAGITVWSISANACRQFNRFHARFAQATGALLVLAPDAWSLWLWDARGRPRYVRSRWRKTMNDHAEIALEVERMILAYVHGDPGRSVTRVHALAGEETEAIVAALDIRLHEACVSLHEDSGYARGQSSATLSIAAALEQ